jgi:uncharacterized damage-inducible protein DinB
MPSNAETTTTTSLTGERADLLATLTSRRHFLRFTTRGLTDEQAAQRPTASELCLGGLIKHVAETESSWVDFILGGAAAMRHETEAWKAEDWLAKFQMMPGETLADLLGRYETVASRTDGLLSDGADLDRARALPEAPWFEKGARWSTRRVLLHIIAETAQHAGHADIIRQSIDGAKSMG